MKCIHYRCNWKISQMDLLKVLNTNRPQKVLKLNFKRSWKEASDKNFRKQSTINIKNIKK